MRAQQNSHALEAPGDHGPAPGDVNPFLAGIAAEQRGQCKREWHGESGVAEVQHRRVNHHFRILQQRVQAVAVGNRSEAHHSARVHISQHAERAGHEIIQGEEKHLGPGQHHANVGHQLRMFFAVEK